MVLKNSHNFRICCSLICIRARAHIYHTHVERRNMEICILFIWNIVKILSLCVVLSNCSFIAVKWAYLTLFHDNARISFTIISQGGVANRHCRKTIIQNVSETNKSTVLLCPSLQVHSFFSSYFCIYTILKRMFHSFFVLMKYIKYDLKRHNDQTLFFNIERRLLYAYNENNIYV